MNQLNCKLKVLVSLTLLALVTAEAGNKYKEGDKVC